LCEAGFWGPEESASEDADSSKNEHVATVFRCSHRTEKKTTTGWMLYLAIAGG